jgi:uncharacterized protein YkwD
MNCSIKNIFTVISITSAAMLTACGGGSGGNANPNATPSASTGTVPIVTAAAPTPTYAAGSEELAAFNQINLARSTCGFGTLRQNTLIDTATENHAVWMAANSNIAHNETPNTTGFTAVDSFARLTYVGYKWQSAGEVLSGIHSIAKSGYGAYGTRLLLSAPYHLMGLMQGNREIGITVKTSGPTGSGADIVYPGAAPTTFLVADMGSDSTYLYQTQGTSDVLTYPCQGITNTATKLENESPNPIANRDLATNPVGQPVFVQVAMGQTLSITTASIVTTVGSNPVAIAKTLTASNDDNRIIRPNQAILIPDAPLAANTEYTVTIQGTNNGAMFLKSFTFTTGV